MEATKEIILGLDISTTTIGCAIVLNDGSEYGKLLELTHVAPKVPKKIGEMETLFLKKKIFNDEFLKKWQSFGITRVVIESPLIQSNNAQTVATLLKFNGMISDCIYTVLGIVPQYISSYDAREYSFPELMSIRKYGKDEKQYPKSKIMKEINECKLVLFGGYPWTIDKKTVIQGKVAEVFPDIEWLYDKKGELKKENFDACDAYVAVLGYINMKKHGIPNFKINNVNTETKEDGSTKVTYDVNYWDKTEHRTTYIAA